MLYLDAIKFNWLNPVLGYGSYFWGLLTSLSKRHAQAFPHYNRAVKLNPEHANSYYVRGLCQKDLARYPQALADFNQAFLLNPKYISPATNLNFFFQRGYVYLNLANYGYAILDFNRALGLKPAYYLSYGNRALCYFYTQKYEQALADANTYISNGNPLPFIYNVRAHTHYFLKNYNDCLADCETFIGLNPSDPDGYAIRGLCYYRLKQPPKAVADLTTAIGLATPTNAVAITYNRVLAYLELADLPQARIDLLKITATVHPEGQELRVAAGWMMAWLAMGRFRPGLPAIKELIAIADQQPEHYTALVARAVELGLRGRWEVALIELERAIERAPLDWDAYFWKGIALAYLDQPGAAPAIEQALAYDLPALLLTPLYWLETDRPAAFNLLKVYLGEGNGRPSNA